MDLITHPRTAKETLYPAFEALFKCCLTLWDVLVN